ncbi:MAG: replicative DNA helicase [Verrucomicrobiales bacterium]|jgi:replicative DNA helicase
MKSGDAVEVKPTSAPQKSKGKAGPNLQKPGKKLSTSSAQSSAQEDVFRIVPHSVEAEKAVLSSMLQAPSECIGEAMEGKLFADLFYSEGRQILYRTIVELYDNGQPANPIALTDLLRDRKQLDLVGGPSAIAEVMRFVASAADFGYYTGKLREKFILRRIISTSNAFIAKAYDEVPNITDLLDAYERDVLQVRESMESDEVILSIQEHLVKAIDHIQEMLDNPNSMAGVETGYNDFDKMTRGMQAGQMIVVAARPGMGKTSFAMNVVENVALKTKTAVAVFSLEMTSEQLVQRMLCSQAKIPMFKLLGGGALSEKRDFPRLTAAASRLAEAKIFIDDTPALSIMALRAKARRLKKQHNIGLIAIDYLQLLKSESKAAEQSRQNEVAEISQGVKALAKELELPIMVLAQLNRGVEGRTSNRPKLSDLRESGSIEQDADVVALLMRDAYYAESDADKDDLAGKATLIVAKQRNGATGDVSLFFNEEIMRFENGAKQAEPGE